jgi:hypothetical protein
MGMGWDMADKGEVKYDLLTDDYIRAHMRKMRQEDLARGSIRFDKQFVDASSWNYKRDYRISISVNIEITTEKERF